MIIHNCSIGTGRNRSIYFVATILPLDEVLVNALRLSAWATTPRSTCYLVGAHKDVTLYDDEDTRCRDRVPLHMPDCKRGKPCSTY